MGWKSVIGCGQAGNDTVNLAVNNGGSGFTAYGPVGGIICTPAWEANPPLISLASGQLNNHSAHTASNMSVRITSSTSLSANVSLFLNVGGSDLDGAGNMMLVLLSKANHGGADYGNVSLQDLSHTDAVPGGQTLALAESFAGTGQSGQILFEGVFWEADQPGGACVPFSASPNGASSSNFLVMNTKAPRWIGLNGGMVANASAVGEAQAIAPTGGTWSNIQANVHTAPGGAGTLHYYFKSCLQATFNGTTTPNHGNQVLAIPDNIGAGIVDDASGTDAVPQGYLINYEHSEDSGGPNTITYSAIGSTWTSAEPNVTPMITADTPGSSTYSGVYVQFNNSPRLGNSQLEGLAVCPTGGTFSSLSMLQYGAPASGAPVFSFFNTGALGNQTVTIGATPGVVVQDLSHTDAVPAGGTFANSSSNNANFLLGSQAVAFRTPDGTGAFGMGL